jgi:transcriptional regulator of nitric oxide reductase
MVIGMTVLVLSSATASSKGDHQARQCARQFETAQRIDMESFRDYDAEAFRAIHHPDAVTVFASGAVRYGIDAIMATHASHFADRQGIWAWTEIHRVVDGCKTAFILYDTTYDIPSIGFHQHALTGVTYTRHKGKWLALADQGTMLQ